MTVAPDWIAADWGSSHLRIWAMEGRRALAMRASAQGAATLAPADFPAALAALADPWLDAQRGGAPSLTVMACGMVGARRGWAEAPYVPVPCAPLGPVALRAPGGDPRLAVWIVPGLSQSDPPDVMRGEETQIAGFLEIEPRFDGVLCLPGTHSKWARVSAGEVVSFASFMTGEMFALLSEASVLRHTLRPGWDDAAFAEAVDEALSRPERLVSRLFGLRAAALLARGGDGGQDSRHAGGGGAARARMSGLLIGAELAAARPYWLGQAVGVIGAAPLADHYAAALAAQGVSAVRADAAEMVRAGLARARSALLRDAA